ncbi:MAG: GNAT family N-acetyltransferase [Mycobacterium sp.]
MSRSVELPIGLSGRPGDSITIAGYRPADLADLFAAVDHDEVWTHIPGARPSTPDELVARLTAVPLQQPLVIRHDSEVVGTSSFFLDPSNPLGVEVGMTLLAPQVWSSGLNTTVKQVMLSAAFGAGAEWVQLRTDERNHRSAAAILKLRGVIEIQPRVESQWIRRDGTVRTSRMFRVPK